MYCVGCFCVNIGEIMIDNSRKIIIGAFAPTGQLIVTWTLHGNTTNHTCELQTAIDTFTFSCIIGAEFNQKTFIIPQTWLNQYLGMQPTYIGCFAFDFKGNV